MKNSYRFSWWYFDCILDNKMKLVVIFYDHPYFLTFEKGLMDVLIYQNGEKKYFSSSDRSSKCKFQKEPLYLTISSNQLLKTDSGYLLDINVKSLVIKLKLDITYNYWKLLTIPLYHKKNYYFNWKVYAPSLDVKGTMVIQGEKINVKGKGYLDSNEGNLVFNKFLNSWVWGRIFGSNRTVIFGSLNFNDKSIFQPVLICDHKNSHDYNLIYPIIFNEEKLQFRDSTFSEVFYIEDQNRIDAVELLISKIPQSWKFARQIHEIIFYGLERFNFGKHLNKVMANFKYERYSANLVDSDRNKYQSVLETIHFR